jgi:hypothetical protein
MEVVANYSNYDPRALDAAIARVALHGNVTHEQLVGLGLNNGQIAYRAKIGRLHPEHRRVYGVGRRATTALERASAAVLACGEGAALSHRAALALWGLAKWSRTMHVTVPKDRRLKGIRVHRAPGLLRRDLRTHQGIRATSPARTILDCAPGLTDKALARAVNDGRRSQQARLRPHQLADVVARFPNHPGARRLKPFVDAKGGPTRSEWEDAFPAFCKQYELPEPVMSTRVAGYEADAVLPDEKIVIELDSWDFHSGRDAFESDRDRDVDRLVAGFVTVRITWERIEKRSRREAARLHKILRQRRRRAA